MPACLVKIAGMASSKRRGASSGKQTSAGKARVISVRSTDPLPRKGNASTGRRKPVMQPSVDAPMAKAVASANKRAHRPQQTIATPARSTARASGKLNKRAAREPVRVAAAVVPETVEVATPGRAAEQHPADMIEAPVEAFVTVETEEVVEASAIVEEMTIDEVPFALAIEQPRVSAETRGLLLARTAADNAASRTPAREHGKRALVTAVSRLLSTLLRWTGVRP
jgi:hypothetical protein